MAVSVFGTLMLQVANIILDGRFGGPQNRILQVSEGLRDLGVETLILIPAKDSDIFYNKLTQKNLLVERLKIHSLKKELLAIVSYLVYLPRDILIIANFIRKRKINLVHCNISWQVASVIATKLAGAKVILHLNDTWDNPAIKLVSRSLAPLCDGLIFSSQRTKDCYHHLISNRDIKSMISYPPVSTDSFNPDQVRSDSKLSAYSSLKITTVANINPTKGLESFILMAAILNKKYQNISFHIVGSVFNNQRGYFDKLIEMINELELTNVFYYGYSDNVAAILKASDIFICTSLSEAGPMTVWEAMAMKKPVVTTNVGDIDLLIENGKTGFVVPIGDVNELAAKVGCLIEDDDLRRAMGARARQEAVRQVDLRRVVQKHKEFYLEVLQSGE